MSTASTFRALFQQFVNNGLANSTRSAGNNRGFIDKFHTASRPCVAVIKM